jgi:hypothetical protein
MIYHDIEELVNSFFYHPKQVPNRNKEQFTKKNERIKPTFGNVVDNGSHVDKAKTPPSVCGDVNAKESRYKGHKKKKNFIPA